MNWEQRKEYQKKATIRRGELIDRLYLNPDMSRIEKDILTLEMIELDIMPDSRWWRWGYKSVLKRARLALKEKMEREQDEQHKL